MATAKKNPNKRVLKWETVETERQLKGLVHSKYMVERAKVPGGWLVISQFLVGPAHGLAFVPDPNHEWDGTSVR